MNGTKQAPMILPNHGREGAHRVSLPLLQLQGGCDCGSFQLALASSKLLCRSAGCRYQINGLTQY